MDQIYCNGAEPPNTVISRQPFAAPEQVTSVATTFVITGPDELLILTSPLAEHPDPSVTVTVYVPAKRFDSVESELPSSYK